jgi:hypothetical protein
VKIEKVKKGIYKKKKTPPLLPPPPPLLEHYLPLLLSSPPLSHTRTRLTRAVVLLAPHPPPLQDTSVCQVPATSAPHAGALLKRVLAVPSSGRYESKQPSLQIRSVIIWEAVLIKTLHPPRPAGPQCSKSAVFLSCWLTAIMSESWRRFWTSDARSRKPYVKLEA